METPHTDHLTAEDYDNVYEPAEDSFLMLDALEADLPFLKQLQPCTCLEIGSGSGILITALAKELGSTLCFATDKNPHACKATKRTARRNATTVDTIYCNLADAIQSHSIDLLFFNPPYVVTTDEELQQLNFPNCKRTQGGKNLTRAWAGGERGRRIIDELLKDLNNILSEVGVLYLLVLRENKPEEIIEQLECLGFDGIVFMERRIPGEYLTVMKIKRR